MEQAAVRELSLMQQRLNTACPYFTMFPLSFPLEVLREAALTDRVLDRSLTRFPGRFLCVDYAAISAAV